MNFFKFISSIFLILTFGSCQDDPITFCRNISSPNVSCPPTFSTFLDPRDSFSYQTVTICNQTWFAENARYNTPDSILHQHPSMNPDYAMYSLDVLSEGKRYYNAVSMQYACPNGWHVPTDRDWNTLELNLGMNPLDTADTPNVNTIPNQGQWFRACGVPALLMSTTGWNDNGTNASGFNLIGPNEASLWTSSSEEIHGRLEDVIYWVRQFYTEYDHIKKSGYLAFSRFECRCIED
jgi:uncharacterized protein (TIGR02145 family)